MKTSKEIVIDFINNNVNDVVEHIKKKYDFPNLNVTVKIRNTPKAKVSRGGIKGGVSFISLVINRFITAAETNSLIDGYEYSHYRNDPVIGELKNVHWTKALKLLICHELAHVVQFGYGISDNAAYELGLGYKNQSNIIFKKHNEFFQKIYADLRINFVNSTECLNEQNKTVEINETSVPVKQEIKTKKYTNKKGWYSKEIHKGKGRYFFYYTVDGKYIGCLFSLLGHPVYIYDVEKKTYEKTQSFGLVQARKEIFGL